MSEAKPIYSKNPILDGLEHIGHGIHVAEHATVGFVTHGVRDVLVIADDFKAQMPTVLEDNGAVIDAAAAPDLLALDAAFGVALGTAFNPVAWWTVLVCALKAAPKIAALAAAVRTLYKTLGADISADAASLKG
jgi:hypothetical protein